MRAFCESTPAIKVKRVELSPAVVLSRPVSDFPGRFTATFLVHGPVTENAGENGQCEHTFIVALFEICLRKEELFNSALNDS